MSKPWHCEDCGEQYSGQPASIEKYPGPEGQIELWFCGECTRYER